MPVSVIIPTADTQSDWTPSSGGDNFAMVDEDTHDDGSTYNETSTQNNRDLFTGADLSIPSDATINEVRMHLFARKVPGQAVNMGFSSKHDSTTNHTSFALTTGFVKYTEDITALESWLPADFDGVGRAEFGYYHDQSQSRAVRVTNIWLEVRWTPVEPTNDPGTTVDDSTVGTQIWANPNNTQASDDTYATAAMGGNVQSHYIKATNFGFTIGQVSDGSTIDGIEVAFEVREDEGTDRFVRDESVKIVKGGTIGSTEKASNTRLTRRDTSIIIGSPTDKWGETWTPADIRASGFGVAVSLKETLGLGATDTFFDHIEITIYLTAGTNGQRTVQTIIIT